MKKSKIDQILSEFIDSELNIIGNNTMPTTGNDLASKTGSKPTDYHRHLAHQQHTDDYLGRIGTAMFENEGQIDPTVEKVAKKLYLISNPEAGADLKPWEENTDVHDNYRNQASEVIALIQGNDVQDDQTLSEADIKKVMEDKLTSKKDTSISTKTDSDGLPDSVKKITDLISNLAKKDRDILMKRFKK